MAHSKQVEAENIHFFDIYIYNVWENDQPHYRFIFTKSLYAELILLLMRRVTLDPRMICRQCVKFWGSPVPALYFASLVLNI